MGITFPIYPGFYRPIARNPRISNKEIRRARSLARGWRKLAIVKILFKREKKGGRRGFDLTITFPDTISYNSAVKRYLPLGEIRHSFTSQCEAAKRKSGKCRNCPFPVARGKFNLRTRYILTMFKHEGYIVRVRKIIRS